MEIQQLIYFVEIAETQSFTKAAGKLFISQPALSKSLHRLEEELDTPLLLRNGKHIVLTEAGELLYQRAKKILASVETIPVELNDLRGKNHPNIRIKSRALGGIVPEIINEYQKKHPEVSFTLRTGGELTIQETEYDFIIKPTYEDYEGRNSRLLLNEIIYLAVPSDDPIAQASSFRIEELQARPLILPSKNCFFYDIVHGWLEEHGITPSIQADSDDPNMIIDLVQNGGGISLIPEHSVSSRNLSGIRMIVPEDRKVFSRGVLLQWNDFGYLSSDAKLFRRFLCSYFSDMEESLSAE